MVTAQRKLFRLGKNVQGGNQSLGGNGDPLSGAGDVAAKPAGGEKDMSDRRSPEVRLTVKCGAGCFLLLAALCSCADVHNSKSFPHYAAFGDSITYGAGLGDRQTEAYPYLVAGSEHVKVFDYAYPGDQACDIPTHQVFQYGENPALAAHEVSSVLIGTNDVDFRGAGAYEQVFLQCHRAVLAWQGLPAEYKVVRGEGGFDTRGRGSVTDFRSVRIWMTGEQGAEIRTTITLAQKGSIYAWPVIDDASDATYSYALDARVIGNATVRTDPLISTRNGTTRSVGLVRIPNVPAGKHVVTFVQTSTGDKGVSVMGIGSPGVRAGEALPIVLAGTVPFQLHDDRVRAGCRADDSPCLQYIEDIKNDVAMFVGDGLDVKLFDTRKYMFGTAAEMVDGVHPNALGQRELAKSVEDVWPVR